MSFVTTYRDRGKPQRIYAFLRGENGLLRVKYWNGTTWSKWGDHGAPGTAILTTWGVITDFHGNRRIYAFCIGEDSHVYLHYGDGTRWKWVDQGKPPGSGAILGPSVVSYPQGDQQRIYGFVTGTDANLHLLAWDDGWKWGNLGTPAGVELNFSLPEAVTYSRARQHRVAAFIVGGDGHLYRNYWNGKQWRWVDHGEPPGTTAQGYDTHPGRRPPGAIAYDVGGGVSRIVVFVAGANGHLYRNWFNGTRWQWADQGNPPGTAVEGTPAVITYFRTRRVRRFGRIRQTYIHAFLRGSDGHLYSNVWDGKQWYWHHHGTPADTSVELPSLLAAVTYRDGSEQRIYVFAPGSEPNRHLFVNYWIGTSWKWTDLGEP